MYYNLFKSNNINDSWKLDAEVNIKMHIQLKDSSICKKAYAILK